MRRGLRLASLVSFVVALLLVTGGAVYADDCASPPDCSNTAWTVGGGAAAAAAIVAAAAAAGWLPDLSSETELSPECTQQLESLSGPISDTYLSISEVTVAREGAFRSLTKAKFQGARDAISADEILKRAGAGDYNWSAALAYGNEATVAGIFPEVGKIGAQIYRMPEHLRRAAAEVKNAQMLKNAADLKTKAKGIREAARATRAAAARHGKFGARLSQGRLDRLANQQNFINKMRGSSMLDDAAKLETMADDVLKQAPKLPEWSRLGKAVNYAGKALGVYSIGSTTAGLYQAGKRADALRIEGMVRARSEAAAMEAQRWQSYMGEMNSKLDAYKSILSQQIGEYNFVAAGCGAKPISPDAIAGLMGDNAATVAGQQQAVTGETPPPSVLEQPPERIDEDDPFEADCGSYQSDVANYEQERADSERLEDLKRWQQRDADLTVTIGQMQGAFNEAQSKFLSAARQQAGSGFLSGATSAVALLSCINPPVAIGLGLVSLFTGLYSGYATPEEWNTRYVGRLAWELERMRETQRDAQGEINRQREIWNAKRSNLKVRYRQLNVTYRMCQGNEKGWSTPTNPGGDGPSFSAPSAPIIGQPRSIQEIGTWR